jgi:hypothetical protein
MLTAATSNIALGAASTTSNCGAVLTSFFGRQGLVDDAAHILQDLAALQGVSFGQLVGTVVREEGTVNECLAFLGFPPA